MTEEDALWRAIGAAPEDQLPRLVAADWYDERAGMVYCPLCKGDEQFGRPCKVCKATGRTSNGHAETAAALRATAQRLPYRSLNHLMWCWVDVGSERVMLPHGVETKVYLLLSEEAKALAAETGNVNWSDYPTAADAIRDLCRAWAASRSKQEVRS